MAESPPAGVATTGEPPPPHTIPHQPKKGPADVVTLSKIRPLQLRPLNVRLVKERARTLLASTFALAFLFTLGASFAGSLTAWSSVKDGSRSSCLPKRACSGRPWAFTSGVTGMSTESSAARRHRDRPARRLGPAHSVAGGSISIRSGLQCPLFSG